MESFCEVGGEDGLGVEGCFELGVCFKRVHPNRLGEMTGGEGGIFGEVEATTGLENEFVHLVGESPDGVFVALGDLEI